MRKWTNSYPIGWSMHDINSLLEMSKCVGDNVEYFGYFEFSQGTWFVDACIFLYFVQYFNVIIFMLSV